MEKDDFKSRYLCDWSAWKSETNVECSNCHCPHMNNDGVTNNGYPRYKCGNCGCRDDKDPKYMEHRRRIDAKIASQRRLANHQPRE